MYLYLSGAPSGGGFSRPFAARCAYLSLLLLSSAPLLGYPVDTTRAWFPHIGLSSGWIMGDMRVNKTRCHDKGILNLSVTGASLGLSGGLTYRPDGHFFFCYEIAGFWHDGRGSWSLAHIPYTTLKVRHTHTYGAYGYIGYTCLTTNPFVRFGLVRGRFTALSHSDTFVGEEEGVGGKKLWRLGANIALGIDVCVVRNLLMGILLSHTRYQRFSFQTSGDLPKAHYEIKPTVSSGYLRFKILF